MTAKYTNVPFIICYDEGNSMHSNHYDTEKLLKIKQYNPGTLTQILLYYDVYMFYEEENFPLEDITQINYTVYDNLLILDGRYTINNHTKIYFVTYNDEHSEFQFNISEIVDTFTNLSKDERECFFWDDFEYNNFPILANTDHKVFYSEIGIRKFYEVILKQFRHLVSLNAPEKSTDKKTSKVIIEELFDQLKNATLHIESVIEAFNQKTSN